MMQQKEEWNPVLNPIFSKYPVKIVSILLKLWPFSNVLMLFSCCKYP